MGATIDVKLLHSVSIDTYGEVTTTEFNGVSVNSHHIKEGSLFLLLEGNEDKAKQQMDAAIHGGAKAILVERSSVPHLHSSTYPVFVTNSMKDSVRKMAKHLVADIEPTVIAVVGKDKAVTADVTAAILSKNYNIYRPSQQNGGWLELCLTLLNMEAETDIAILEYGLHFEGELAELSQMIEPNVAIITEPVASLPFTEKTSSGTIIKEIGKIETGMKASALTIINGDIPDMVNREWKTDTVLCGESENCIFQIISKELEGNFVHFQLKGVHMPFTMNKALLPFIKNVVFGIAVAVHLGVLPDDMQPPLKDFQIK